MPHTWQKALDSYQYSVRLSDFKDAPMYRRSCRRWFEYDTGIGDRSRTMEFEERFRELGPHSLKAWYEVVFWKHFSSEGTASHRSRTVIDNIKRSSVSASRLWRLCQRYVEDPNQDTFQSFRQNLVKGSAVAVAATFPAFICPEKFPMVDKHVADWARHNRSRHSYQKIGGPVLAEAPDLSGSVTALRDDIIVHREFVKSWIEWCQFTAGILNQRSEFHWRARDVEMAVFTAEISQKRPAPWDRLTLKPLT